MILLYGSNMTAPEKQLAFKSEPWFWTFYLLTIVVGGFLRLYLISDQIILDDDWHALNFTINHSLWYLLTHFSYAGANIIPMNAYVRMLLVSSGWSEILLILPSLVAGGASLLLFPLVLKRVFNSRTTIFFAFLFAVSPLIIFYSRVCRSYSIYTFLGFLSIWIFYEWSLTGEKKFGWLFAVTGILCVYFHFVGVIFIFVPLVCAAGIKLIPKFPRLPVIREKILPGFKELISVGCGILICLAILLTAAFIQRVHVINADSAHFSIDSMLGFLQILSGTSHLFPNIFFYALLGIGLIRLFRKSFLLGLIFISVFIAYVFVSLVTKSNFAHVPLVLARYIIPAFPMAYVLVALGIDSLWMTTSIFPVNKKIINAACYGVAGCFLAGLVWTGPLRQTYVAPNNFTNHSVFQESYAPINWDSPSISPMLQRSYALNKDTMSVFYKTLADQRDVKKIIEYPVYLGNGLNLLYYYQRFHRKKVAEGYTLAIKVRLDSVAGIYGNMIPDMIFVQVIDPAQLKFKNMVNILDMAAIKNSRADLVIFHKNPESEILEPHTGSDVKEIRLITDIAQVYRESFGQPIFEDRYLLVFKVHD
jgi:hypothetical protein